MSKTYEAFRKQGRGQGNFQNRLLLCCMDHKKIANGEVNCRRMLDVSKGYGKVALLSYFTKLTYLGIN